MRVNYLSYCEGQFLPGKRALEFVSLAVSKLTKSPKKEFENISGYPELLKKLSECFSQSNIIILAVDVKCFNKTKSVLFKTMNLKCKKNSEIIRVIKTQEKLSDLTENQIVAQAAVPVDAETFVTVDGLFCGFGIEKNRQRFVVIPLDSERVDVQFIEDLCVFLNKNKENYIDFDEENEEEPSEENIEKNVEKDVDEILADVDEKVEENIQEVEDIAQEEVNETEEETEAIQETVEEDAEEEIEELNIVFEKPKFTQEPEIEEIDDEEIEIIEEFDIASEKKENESRNDDDSSVETRFENYTSVDGGDIIAETLTNIKSADLKIAFAAQSDNKVIENYLNSKIVFKNNSNFAVVNSQSITGADNEEQFKSKLSVISREAMTEENAAVGMAVSNLLEDEDGRQYVFSAMCDQNKTNVYKVYAIPGESHEDVVKSAIINMFESLNAKVVKYNESHQEAEGKKRESKKAKKMQKSETSDKKSSNIPLVVLIVIFALLCVAVALVLIAHYTGSGFVFDLVEKIKSFFVRT